LPPELHRTIVPPPLSPLVPGMTDHTFLVHGNL
jgi:hypothetical protein